MARQTHSQMETTDMSKATATKVHAASWSITGRGASKRYRMAIPATSKASKGDRFKAVSKVGIVTTGTLVDLTSVADGVELWEFTRDTKSPEQIAHDRALRADAQRAYWDSDAGRQTAERIKARAESKAQTTSDTTSDTTEQVPTVVVVDPMAEMIGRLVRSGLTPEQAASAALAVLGSAPATTTAPATTAPTTARKARTTKSTTAPTTTTDTTDETARKRVCPTCGAVAVLKHHKGFGAAVCGKCHPADTDTLKLRAARLAKA